MRAFVAASHSFVIVDGNGSPARARARPSSVSIRRSTPLDASRRFSRALARVQSPSRFRVAPRARPPRSPARARSRRDASPERTSEHLRDVHRVIRHPRRAAQRRGGARHLRDRRARHGLPSSPARRGVGRRMMGILTHLSHEEWVFDDRS